MSTTAHLAHSTCTNDEDSHAPDIIISPYTTGHPPDDPKFVWESQAVYSPERDGDEGSGDEGGGDEPSPEVGDGADEAGRSATAPAADEVHGSALAVSDERCGPGEAEPTDDDRLHDLMRALQCLGNDVRLRFIQALRDFNDRRSYHKYGYPSLDAYSELELGIPRSTAFEYVRAAVSLDGLPRTRTLFREGELSWQQVRLLTRVATAATEAEWIKLAWEVTSTTLTAEVREAQRTGRDAPRDRRYGLPNIMVRFVCEMSLDEELEVETAFQNLREVLEGVAGPASDEKPPLVRLARAINLGLLVPAQAPPGHGRAPAGRSNGRGATNGNGATAASDGGGEIENGTGAEAAHPGAMATAKVCTDVVEVAGGPAPVVINPVYKIVFFHNLDTGDTTVDTLAGRVSVSESRLAEIAPHAESIKLPRGQTAPPAKLPNGQIDPPNSSHLSNQVRDRDARRCTNPACRSRRNLQSHHLIKRSEGGPTTLANGSTVCATCHALIESGLLEVTGSAQTGLVWRVRPRSLAARVRDVDELHKRLHELQGLAPEPWAVQNGPALPSLRLAPTGDSTAPDPRLALVAQIPQYTAANVKFLATGLSNMGMNQRESEELIREAFLVLAEKARADGKVDEAFEACFGEAAILYQAFRLNGAGIRGT